IVPGGDVSLAIGIVALGSRLLPKPVQLAAKFLVAAERGAIHEGGEQVAKALPAARETVSSAPKWVEGLPNKVRKQIEKAQLPLGGETPFRPKLTTKRGQTQIATAEVTHGPRSGEIGRVDTEGRIWLRDKPHAGYPAHWDVQQNGGRSHTNVGFDGNPIKRD